MTKYFVRVAAPAEIAPRVENGVDFGRPGRVLVRRGPEMIRWTPGGMYWSGLLGRAYAQGRISYVRDDSPSHRNSETYHSGPTIARLTTTALYDNEVMMFINKTMFDGVVAPMSAIAQEVLRALHPKSTVIIEEVA